MGVDVADLNNDGELDIFATDMMPFNATIALKSGGEDTNKVTKIKADFGLNLSIQETIFFLKNHMEIMQSLRSSQKPMLLTGVGPS